MIHRNFYFILPFCILGPHPWHMEVPRLGVKWELQLPAYTTATATQEPSHVCDLHCSSQQHQIFNPLSEVRDGTCILMDTGQVRNLLSHNGNSLSILHITCFPPQSALFLKLIYVDPAGSSSLILCIAQ